MFIDRNHGYSRLIFLSCIDQRRNRMEITRKWNMSEKGRPLYRKGAQEDLTNLHKYEMVNDSGDGIKSIFSGYFQEYIESISGESAAISKELCKLLDEEEIRTNVFNIENIKEFYKAESTENKAAVNKVRHDFSNIFELFLLCLKTYHADENSDILQNLITSEDLPGSSELNYGVIYEATMNELNSGNYEKKLEEIFAE